MTPVEILLKLGAQKAAEINVSEISFDRAFRDMCASNACGNYGRCHMCPPDAGDIDALIEEAKQYSKAVVYQTIGTLEDSYDFEGMMEAGERHNKLAQAASEQFKTLNYTKAMHLGAGGCRVCERCAKKDNLPCRFPDKAMSSLETYGINCSLLAESAGMKYINGQDTVTYFGAFFYV